MSSLKWSRDPFLYVVFEILFYINSMFTHVMLQGVILGAVAVIWDLYFLMNINLMAETIEHMYKWIHVSTHDYYFQTLSNFPYL